MRKRVFLDGRHIALINADEIRNTVIAEIETENGAEFVYAEKFDDSKNLEKEAIKACVRYIQSNAEVT